MPVLISAKKGLGQWLVGPRLIMVSASISAVLILIVVGSMWLTTNHTGDITPSNILVRSGIDHGAAPPTTIAAMTPVAISTPKLLSQSLLLPRQPYGG